ncbi:MAG: M13 family metallopeptidase [Glaciecola sp.]|nr:M13 family metallopeptidase [Glaciecola sp.]MDG1922191.1 M13 family metallopeptidase [Glaciecola sp.]
MKKTTIATLVAASFILGGCTGQAPTTTTSTVVEAVAAKAELGSFGVELSARNLEIKPGDDFFMYASGNWYDNYELPADKTRFGAFSKLAERSNDEVKAIIEDLAAKENLSGTEKLVADYYNAYMDTDTLDALGITPLQATLTDIANIADVAGLTKTFGEAWLTGTTTPIWGGMWTNPKDPNQYQLHVGVSGIGLPDRDYYLLDTERFVNIRNEYQNHIAQMLAFAGVHEADAQSQAAAILALETKIAEIQWPREKRRDRDLALNQFERDAFEAEYAGFDWDTFFASSGFAIPTLNVRQPEPVKAAIDLINSEDLATWKAYLTYHTISNNASMLSQDIYTTNFAFFGTVLNGQKEPRPRWKRAISAMSGTESLGFAIGEIYTERYFPESSKAQMAELVENLRTALGQRIDGLDWMGAETKVNAKAKLAAFRPKIGYPDQGIDFAGLDIKGDDLLGNVKTLRKFFQAKDVAVEMEPTDRERWGMTPQQVNAYYNSSFNEIVFPAAILQPPFFDPNADAAVNYGGIGAVIGHEMGHGFDDQGSKSDAEGVQRNWWTDEDRAAFDAKAEKLAAQYSAYEPIEGNFVNGKNSLGENIGDVGGLAMAYHAYQLSLDGKEAPIIDGTTGDQRFFLAWAQVWKEKRTEESMLNQLRGGTHAPGRYRALAPRNHDAWYAAFDVKPGDALYLAPEDRVRIW